MDIYIFVKWQKECVDLAETYSSMVDLNHISCKTMLMVLQGKKSQGGEEGEQEMNI